MTKKFDGSLAILIILIIICWPAAIIYYLMHDDVLECEEPKRTCLRCGAQFHLQYAICPYCGFSFAGQSYLGPQYEQNVNVHQSGQYRAIMYCNWCGQETISDGAFCRKCGKKLD